MLNKPEQAVFGGKGHVLPMTPLFTRTNEQSGRERCGESFIEAGTAFGHTVRPAELTELFLQELRVRSDLI